MKPVFAANAARSFSPPVSRMFPRNPSSRHFPGLHRRDCRQISGVHSGACWRLGPTWPCSSPWEPGASIMKHGGRCILRWPCSPFCCDSVVSSSRMNRRSTSVTTLLVLKRRLLWLVQNPAMAGLSGGQTTAVFPAVLRCRSVAVLPDRP